jgi:hypothetical protein
MDGLKISQIVGGYIERLGRRIGGRKHCHNDLKFRNPFTAALERRMGVGMKPRIVQMAHGWNDVTVVGKNHLLDVTFGNSSPVTQIDPWYIGLINDTPTPVLDEDDTLSSHTGWTELTDYTGNRQAWTDANASAKVKGTTTVSTFPITATVTVNGIFIASAASGTSGILWATGSFDEVVEAVNGDDLKVTYGIRC